MSGMTVVDKEPFLMQRRRWGSLTIISAGYDAQKEMLEVEFASDGQIWQFTGVPEELWYQFRSHHLPDHFFHTYIVGHYPEMRILRENVET